MPFVLLLTFPDLDFRPCLDAAVVVIEVVNVAAVVVNVLVVVVVEAMVVSDVVSSAMVVPIVVPSCLPDICLLVGAVMPVDVVVVVMRAALLDLCPE